MILHAVREHVDEAATQYRRLVAHVRARREAGDYLAADAAARDGIAAVESTLGPTAVELAVLLNELGMIGKYRGSFAEADQLYRRALAIHESLGDMACDNVAAILHNRAGLAHARGDAEAAEPLARHGIAVRRALADPEPLALAADRVALAAILIDLARLDEAYELLRETRDDYEAVCGPAHYEIAITLHNLGSLEYRRGDFAAAAATLQEAAAIKRASLGSRNPDLAITLHNQARCAEELGDAHAAIDYLREAIDLLDGIVADTQPTLVACRARLSLLSSPIAAR